MCVGSRVCLFVCLCMWVSGCVCVCVCVCRTSPHSAFVAGDQSPCTIQRRLTPPPMVNHRPNFSTGAVCVCVCDSRSFQSVTQQQRSKDPKVKDDALMPSSYLLYLHFLLLLYLSPSFHPSTYVFPSIFSTCSHTH